MATTITVAGATGHLGGRIIDALLARGAKVRAVVRAGSDGEKVAALELRGCHIEKVDLSSIPELTAACTGASCVVSALQGLGDVIIDVQSRLLDAAIAAGVARFIPSDFSIDFMKLPAGLNRNLDLRRSFHERLDGAAIRSTSILNGAFAELLVGRMPLIDFAAHRVSYWESPDQRMDFTTMDNTAAFTASAALDPSTPPTLRIAGDAISARELAAVAGEVTHAPFELVRLGGVAELAGYIAHERAKDPEGEQQIFPRWQGMQYMHNMFMGGAKLEPLDNERYPGIHWTTARELIAAR